MIVHVDHIVINGDDSGEVQHLKSYLNSEFEVKRPRDVVLFLRNRSCSFKKRHLHFPKNIHIGFVN